MSCLHCSILFNKIFLKCWVAAQSSQDAVGVNNKRLIIPIKCFGYVKLCPNQTSDILCGYKQRQDELFCFTALASITSTS